jgi:hypothetical protein
LRELWLNDQLVDLYEREAIALTKQVNKLNELKDRQADYSNQFRLPPTGNNLRITGYANQVSSASINPYSKIPCTYIENGSELISNGIAIIEEWSGGDIEVTLYSGIFDFFNQLGDSTLRDLDFSDADHIFNLDNVEAGFESDKYCYPLIQWGATDPDNNTVDIRYQMPGLYADYILDKIFENRGYTKAGEVFNLESYQKLFIPITEDSLIDEEAILEEQSIKAHVEDAYDPYNGSIPSYNNFVILEFPYFGRVDSHNNALWYINDSIYRARKKVSVNIFFQLYFQTLGYAGGTGQLFEVVVSHNGQNILTIDSFDLGYGSTDTFNGKVEGQINNLELDAFDRVYIAIRSNSYLQVNPDGSVAGDVGQYTYFQIEATNTIELGETIQFSNLVPEIKQKDFIKEIMQQYCIVPQIDYLTRTFYFRQFDEIYDRANSNKQTANSNCVDWSTKLYINQINPKDPNNPQIKYRFGSYGQVNNINWIQDDDRGVVGNGQIYIDDNTLPDTVTLFTSSFAASVQDVNLKGELGVNIKRFTLVESEGYQSTVDYSEGDLVLYNGVVYECISDTSGNEPTNATYWEVLDIQYEQTESVEPRILLLRDYENPFSPPQLAYTDGSGSFRYIENVKIAYFVDPAQESDLSYNNLIEQHYNGLRKVLTKTKIVNAKFYLTEADFKGVDFFKPVWIEYFGGYFYINQISNFIAGRLTSVELVRL